MARVHLVFSTLFLAGIFSLFILAQGQANVDKGTFWEDFPAKCGLIVKGRLCCSEYGTCDSPDDPPVAPGALVKMYDGKKGTDGCPKRFGITSVNPDGTWILKFAPNAENCFHMMDTTKVFVKCLIHNCTKLKEKGTATSSNIYYNQTKDSAGIKGYHLAIPDFKPANCPAT